MDNELLEKLRTQVKEINKTFKELEDVGFQLDGSVRKWKEGSDTESPFELRINVVTSPSYVASFR
jgi:exonuclease VII small subunit